MTVEPFDLQLSLAEIASLSERINTAIRAALTPMENAIRDAMRATFDRRVITGSGSGVPRGILSIGLDKNERGWLNGHMPANTTTTTTRRTRAEITAARIAAEDAVAALRNEGWTYRQIGDHFGYSAEVAFRHFKNSLRRAYRLGERGFGVEIECKGLSCAQAALALQHAGISAYDEQYNHTTRPHWKVVPDGSISGGCEVVSPILAGEDGLNELRQVMQTLSAAGAIVDTMCGMHVHVDARDLTGDQFARVFAFYTDRQALMDQFVAPSRRRNSYCNHWDPTMAQRVKDAARDHGKEYAVAEQRDQRYLTVNLLSYSRYGSIEFRQHQGTLNGTKACAWVRLLLAIVTKVEATAEEAISATDVDAMLAGLGLPDDVRQYLSQRAHRLSAR